MSRSMALLLRTARDEQREIGDELLFFFFSLCFLLVYIRDSLVDSYLMNVTGIKRILSELADPLNKCGGATLLYHVMIRDASEKSLHSKAGKALSFLLKDSTFSSCDDFPQGKSSFPNIC